MSLINIPENLGEDKVSKILDYLSELPDSPEKTKFLQDLAIAAARPLITAVQQVAPATQSAAARQLTYRQAHPLHEHGPGIKRRGSVIFVDDTVYSEAEATDILTLGDAGASAGYDDIDVFASSDFSGIQEEQDVDAVIGELRGRISGLTNVLGWLESAKAAGGKYVVWNNDNDFDYDSEPESAAASCDGED